MLTIDMAARMAKRMALLQAICRIQVLIDTARKAQTRLERINNQITNSLNAWTRALSTFQSSVMAPVIVTDKFEGSSAQAISAGLPDPIAEMDRSKSSAEGVQGEIGVQISKLEIYISKKEQEIAELRAQLAAI